MKKGIIALSMLAVGNIYAQDVTPYTPGQTEGIVYYLPQTELQIKVTAVRTAYTPGEFCQYADRYLRLQGISSQPSEQWTIKNVEVIPFGVPNPERAYSVKLKDKSVSSQVELTKDGIIKAINTTSPEEKPAAKLTPQKKERVNPRSFMTEEILLAGSSIKMAELVAKEIYNIRESKNRLTLGKADYMPKDGEALQIMLDNLNTQEQALTEMFAGYSENTDHEFTFVVHPQTDLKDSIVCRFSNKLGILKPDNLAGEPICISLTQKNPTDASTEDSGKKKQPNGIIYNIPGKAQVTVKNGRQTYFDEEVSFAQFGETEVLVNSLFNKKVNTRVIFDPVTGGILKIDKD
ncbi:MAG: DUF4831 family protein [Bacteroides sp.]|nr:DUF4831 family protein [Bacteroides sp.]